MTCTQKSDCGHECGRPHHADLHWPGKPPIPVCYHHAVKAAGVAEALGCYTSTLLAWTADGLEYGAALFAVEGLGGDPRALGGSG